jgi:hypothetical protein
VPANERSLRGRHGVPAGSVHPGEGETLKWYVAVPGFRRGFCSECGSSLFFEEEGGERVSIAAGSLDKPQGLKIAAHIFASEAGDYYEIEPSVPVSLTGEHNVPLP